jgi:hypothetical protein
MKSPCKAAGILFSSAFGLVLVSACNVDNGAMTGVAPVEPAAEYVEMYACNKRLPSGDVTCVSMNIVGDIVFLHLGGQDYEARETANQQRVYRGTFKGRRFDWTATDTDGSAMTGSWTFDPSMESFSGIATYAASDGSYTGSCGMTGRDAQDGIAPNLPTAPSGCPYSGDDR